MRIGDWIDSFASLKCEGGKKVIEVFGSSDSEVEDLTVDSRDVRFGTLFIAIQGTQQDGHDFVEEAIRKGASAIVSQQPYIRRDRKGAHSFAFVRVADSKEALAHLAPYFFKDAAAGLHLLGVTGTNGKTTTAYLIDALLRESGLRAGLLSTVTYRLGLREITPKNTTPGLLDLHRFFSMMRASGLSHVTMEASSHALHQGRVRGCRFEAAVFTNLTEDHLDYHETMESYYLAKKKLFDQTKGRCLINGDDAWGRRLLEAFSSKAWSYGIKEQSDITPIKFQSDLNGISMQVQTPLGEIEVTSPLIGLHNVYNLLAAIGVGLSLGISKEIISSGIQSLKGIPGRFEKIDQGQDFTVLVDYAHTADALSKLLHAVSDLSPKRIITLFGCGGDRDRGKRPKMAAVAAALSQKVVLTSDNPRSEVPIEIIHEVEKGFQDRRVDYESIVDRGEAIRRAITLAEPGDAVVIAGKGHETYQQVGAERFPFDDREMARQALAGRS